MARPVKAAKVRGGINWNAIIGLCAVVAVLQGQHNSRVATQSLETAIRQLESERESGRDADRRALEDRVAAENRAAEDRETFIQLEKDARAPLLVFTRPFASCPVLFRDSAANRTVDIIGRACPCCQPGIPHQYPYATIENVGGGAAIDCKITWKLTSIRKQDGPMRSVSDSDSELNRESEWLWPKVIGAGMSTELGDLPSFLKLDSDLQISEAGGVVQIQCKDLAGRNRVYDQEFVVFTTYHEPNGKSEESDRPRVTFAFNGQERADGPFPFHIGTAPTLGLKHKAAKPVGSTPSRTYSGGWD